MVRPAEWVHPKLVTPPRQEQIQVDKSTVHWAQIRVVVRASDKDEMLIPGLCCTHGSSRWSKYLGERFPCPAAYREIHGHCANEMSQALTPASRRTVEYFHSAAVPTQALRPGVGAGAVAVAYRDQRSCCTVELADGQERSG